jgi:hypothetical protein
MKITEFLTLVFTKPEQIKFTDTISVIDTHYQFTPTAFRNGELQNAVGQNSGSCKLFSFARLHQLTPAQTLTCFGDFYRIDVLQNPDATDHQNIRNFMRFGWDGIEFESNALTPL